jgi:hypothetical protein
MPGRLEVESAQYRCERRNLERIPAPALVRQPVLSGAVRSPESEGVNERLSPSVVHPRGTASKSLQTSASPIDKQAETEVLDGHILSFIDPQGKLEGG